MDLDLVLIQPTGDIQRSKVVSNTTSNTNDSKSIIKNKNTSKTEYAVQKRLVVMAMIH
jgi:hypothetical protein